MCAHTPPCALQAIVPEPQPDTILMAVISMLLVWVVPLAIFYVRGQMSTSSKIASAGVGMSTDKDPAKATAAAVSAAGVPKPTIAFCSCTVAHDPAKLQREFAKKLPGVPIHGITSSGALLQPGGSKPAAVGCLLIEAEPDAFATAFSAEGNATVAASALKRKMAAPQAIVLSATPGAEEGALLAIAAIFPGVKVFGGTAADNDVSGKWSVFSESGASGRGVSLVAVGAGVKFGGSMLGPYTATAKRAVATECDGRKVGMIGGVPAGDWVFEWLGDAVKTEHKKGGMILGATAQKPIGIKQPSGELVPAHLAIMHGERDEGAVTFFTPVPENSEVVVLDSAAGPSTGYAKALVDAFKAATPSGKPKAALLVYCGGMAIAVGDKLDEGLSGPFAKAAEGVPVLGMTCFGEQGVLKRGNCQRNLSMGLITFA